MKVIIKPNVLKGEVNAPPSKSLSHRAIIAAALAKGQSKIENLIFSQDIKATCDAMQNFGINVNKYNNYIEVLSEGNLKAPARLINCYESGSTLRFLIPFGAMVESAVTFEGRGKLKTRPLTPYFNIFDKQSIRYDYRDSLPLVVDGKLKPGRFEISGGISSQFITGLMFVLPLLDGDSEIIISSPLESKGYIDLTLDVLKNFGIDVENDNHQTYRIKGSQKYRPNDYRVEGDYSQAAFWIVAGLIGDRICLKDLKFDSRQGDKEIVDIAQRMNGALQIEKDNIIVRRSETKGIVIDASQCPDIIPVLTVLAALSEGKTEIINASRLRIKESDRLKAISTELNKLGADVREKDDGLVVYSKKDLEGGEVDGWNDHRIVMSLAIASIRCKNEVTIIGSDAIKKSYPTFFDDFAKLGGDVHAE